jgi:hypothetical protein
MSLMDRTTDNRKWWKIDFHTHSPESNDTHMDGVTEYDWLLAFMHAEIDAVAITDHNTGSWIDRIKNAYSILEDNNNPGFRSLIIFPGVEITTCENIHLLAIFKPQSNTPSIESFLDQIGCPSEMRGEASCSADAGIGKIISMIQKSNGIAIPAHIDRKKGRGMFCLNSDPLSDLIASGKISVVESSGLVSDWPDPYQNNPWNWAIITGSDTHTLNDDDPISRTPGSVLTRIFTDSLEFDNLRAFFQSGNSGIVRQIPSSMDYGTS